MSNFLELVSRFERIKAVYKYDYQNSHEPGYLKDYALAQIAIVDSVLQNKVIHGYTKRGLQLFLETLKADDFADLPAISDRIYFINSFNDYMQLLQSEIAVDKLAGVPARFEF